MTTRTHCDIAIIGGGINGCGIARDAAGRGLKTVLFEKSDLASATSSASTKLIHGGLRYLEHYEFRLVREALQEREVLLRMAPHIIWPMRFVLPHADDMRPAWMIRLGLKLYDHLGGRQLLPPTRRIDMQEDALGQPFEPAFSTAFEYSDCWVDDSRLVVLNAVDAQKRGASIFTRTTASQVKATDDGWEIDLEGEKPVKLLAKVLVNAAGPWAGVLRAKLLDHADEASGELRLVQGSHIVLPSLFNGDCAYILQNSDRRIVFAIPFLGKYTMVGTTDREFNDEPENVKISSEETEYLLDVVQRHFRKKATKKDIVWSFSGVRGLFDDKATEAQKVSRDYVIKTDKKPAPLVNVLGGKITTYRRLAETVMEHCAEWCGSMSRPWTAGSSLAGGDFPVDGIDALVERILDQCDGLEDATAMRLARAYGTLAMEVLGDAQNVSELGEHFGADLYENEVSYLIDREWATCADDVLWRRTKLGIGMNEKQTGKLDAWIKNRIAKRKEN